MCTGISASTTLVNSAGDIHPVPAVRTRRIGARMGAPLTVGVDVLPIRNALGGRALPQGSATRSIDGAQVVYGGQLGGGPLIAPADAAGKLVRRDLGNAG